MTEPMTLEHDSAPIAACPLVRHRTRQVLVGKVKVTRVTPQNSQAEIIEDTGIDKGAATSAKGSVGAISRAQLEEIAKTKIKDLTAADMDAAVKTIAGSARSMGLIVEGV